MKIRAMTIEDYHEAYALWNTSLSSVRDIDDSKEAIERFLQRNPGFSVVAEADGKVVGTILCGHDGRRGFLYHVAVDTAQRRAGIAQAMLESCLNKLREENIHKCGLIAFTDNIMGNRFWQRMGFAVREDVYYRDCWINERSIT